MGLSMECICFPGTKKDITKNCINLLLETEKTKSLDSAKPCCFASLTDTWWLNLNRLHNNQTKDELFLHKTSRICNTVDLREG